MNHFDRVLVGLCQIESVFALVQTRDFDKTDYKYKQYVEDLDDSKDQDAAHPVYKVD